jgi:hypothetical protein
MSIDPWWTWLLPLVFAAPWVVGIAWLVRRTPPDSNVPPSFAGGAWRR